MTESNKKLEKKRLREDEGVVGQPNVGSKKQKVKKGDTGKADAGKKASDSTTKKRAAKKDKAEKKKADSSGKKKTGKVSKYDDQAKGEKRKDGTAAEVKKRDATVAASEAKGEATAKQQRTEKPEKSAAAKPSAGDPEQKLLRRSPRLTAIAAPASHPPDMQLGATPAPTDALSVREYREQHAITCEVPIPDPIQSFKDAPFDSRVQSLFTKLGFTAPSPVQAQGWPIAFQGKDLIAIAKTGSGKTLGFLLPAFDMISKKPPIQQGQGPLALVMAPTRELVQQIHVEAQRFGAACGIKVTVVYGGAPKGPQIGELTRGRPALVVGTPGRLNDLLSLNRPVVTNLDSCGFLVLDEADRMLDMGFQPQIESVMEHMPKERQTLFFTATWPKEVRSLASNYLRKDAVKVSIGGGAEKLVANKAITQKFLLVDEDDKEAALEETLRGLPAGGRTIVFCNTKARCESLSRSQRKIGVGTCALHGDKDQYQRERALDQFTRGTCPILFATDVAARGLDVKGVTTVINFDMGDVESYVHRIGRTGRAGSTGESLTLWVKKDAKNAGQLVPLLREAGQEIPDFIEAAASRGGRGGGKGWGKGGRGYGRGGKGGRGRGKGAAWGGWRR